MATSELTYDVESAIARLHQLGPELERGKTAMPGTSYQYYEQIQALGKTLKECNCGRQNLGWAYPEFIVEADGVTWSVGGDKKSKKISCGPKGYHSSEYSNDPPCCR